MVEHEASCNAVRKLVEDLPGEHWYGLKCSVCHRDVSDEWVERHWGSSENPPAIRTPTCHGLALLGDIAREDDRVGARYSSDSGAGFGS
jgi:hypothetical protein